MNSVDIVIDFKRQRWFAYKTTIITTAASLLMTFYMPIYLYCIGFNETIELTRIPPIACANFTRVCYTVQLIVACSMIRKRFEIISGHLKKSYKFNNVTAVYTKSDSVAILQKSVIKLCDGVDLINESFTFQLIFVFSSVLVRH